MLKLMKYEFRKTMFSKSILLLITALMEVMFLIGVFFEWERGLFIGIFGLSLCAMVGIIYVGIDSLLVFHRDLNTKQSYMLFLTPRNSFQILGAKVLENGISIFVTGAFFALLAAVDITTAVLHIGGLQEFIDLVQEVLKSISININIPPQQALIVFMAMLASWLTTVVMGYLAIVLCATVLAGKRLSGLVSFLIFLVLNWLSGALLMRLPDLNNIELRFTLVIAAALVIAAVMYVIAGWIMERKLSV